MKQRVLVVDDETETVKYVSANLRARGYEVVPAYDGREALKLCEQEAFNLVVLDLMLPNVDGYQVCQRIRMRSSMPVLVLSALGREKDIVKALDLGADDYLTKPFGVEELVARVRALLRRSGQEMPVGLQQPLELDRLVINFQDRRVALDGRDVRLTSTEYNLLAYLALNRGRVLSHRTLLQRVWGPEYGEETEYLWTYIRRLRGKIEPDPAQPRYILTEPGVGYRFAPAGD